MTPETIDTDHAGSQALSAVDTGQASIFIKRGAADLAKKDYDQAIVDYSEAIRINPNLSAAYSGRSTAYMAKGDTANGMNDTMKAMFNLGDNSGLPPFAGLPPMGSAPAPKSRH